MIGSNADAVLRLSCGNPADALQTRRLFEHRDQVGSLVEGTAPRIAHLREDAPLASCLDQVASPLKGQDKQLKHDGLKCQIDISSSTDEHDALKQKAFFDDQAYDTFELLVSPALRGRARDRASRRLSELFIISPSVLGSTDYRLRGDPEREGAEDPIAVAIEEEFRKSGGRYGTRRIKRALAERKITASHRKIGEIMAAV